MPRTKKSPKGSWVVTLVKTVKVELICEGCTEEEASADPYRYSVEERELDNLDYEVRKVEPNT